jgi:hypothetical protein
MAPGVGSPLAASLVRDAAGEPSRMVGLLSDITPRKRIEEVVIEIAEGLSASSGDESLRKLVRSFAAVLGVREAFVCECSDYPTTHVRMLARWKAGDYARCVEFDLTGTACEDVICEGRTVFVARDADAVWPLEGQYERRSYLGLPCFDSSGRVIGHIACADDKPMREELPHHAILKILLHAGGDRAGAYGAGALARVDDGSYWSFTSSIAQEGMVADRLRMNCM